MIERITSINSGEILILISIPKCIIGLDLGSPACILAKCLKASGWEFPTSTASFLFNVRFRH